MLFITDDLVDASDSIAIDLSLRQARIAKTNLCKPAYVQCIRLWASCAGIFAEGGQCPKLLARGLTRLSKPTDCVPDIGLAPVFMESLARVPIAVSFLEAFDALRDLLLIFWVPLL